MFDVVVANGRFFGGGLEICPEAKPDDALFDVLTIGDVTKRDLVTTVPKMYRGTHLPHPKAELLRGATVTVTSDVPLPIELDGEQPGTTPITFEVLPRAMRLRVPRTDVSNQESDTPTSANQASAVESDAGRPAVSPRASLRCRASALA